MKTEKVILMIILNLSALCPVTFAQDSLNVSKLGELYGFWTSAFRVAATEDFACVLDQYFGMRIVDITDSYNIVEIGCYNDYSSGTDIEIVGGYAYVTYAGFNDVGLKIIDISNPERPILTGFCITPLETIALAIKDSYAYIIDQDSGG